ncbi:MAG: flagellar hook-length control protein FliK [Pirellulales bacterium]|nr:flagellar hook-length control protein FliK [Pirellulales bacterium]
MSAPVIDPLAQLAPPVRPEPLRSVGEPRFGAALRKAASPGERSSSPLRTEQQDDRAESARPRPERANSSALPRKTGLSDASVAPSPPEASATAEVDDAATAAVDAASAGDGASLLAAEASAAASLVAHLVDEPVEFVSEEAVTTVPPANEAESPMATKPNDAIPAELAETPQADFAADREPATDGEDPLAENAVAAEDAPKSPLAAEVVDALASPVPAIGERNAQGESTKSPALAAEAAEDQSAPAANAAHTAEQLPQSDVNESPNQFAASSDADVAADGENDPPVDSEPVASTKRDKGASSADSDEASASDDAPPEDAANAAAEPAPSAEQSTAPAPIAPNSATAVGDSRSPSTLDRIGAPRAAHLAKNDSPAGDAAGVDRARFVQRVSGAIRTAEGRDGQVRVRLSPPELGSLRIELKVQQGVMHASIEAETTTARNLLLDNLPALRDRLAEQNIRVERFDVDVRRDGNGQQAPSDGQTPWRDANDSGERPPRPDVPRRESRPPTDASAPLPAAPHATDGLDVRI